ncbi:galactose-specific lectin nattectin-like isoform X1 [Etheostoma cragini]|uniref:galactose-specific lectin nattectin-like isoform X1 n=1 Tax=Etheostoma cragini TaxID=417921 RepID=UPI00155E4382|nr:galactose-specific lectin nattectin-like isoform X1 [Etheostoma cragini]
MTSVFPLAVLLCLSSGLLAANGFYRPCPPGWTQFDSRCFGYFIQPKTWLDAETTCIAAGGNLASIHSAAEHAFVKDFIRRVSGTQNPSWIGGTDAVKEGTWMWSDGSAFNYKNWSAREPNNINGGEHCLMMNWPPGENWNDSICTGQFPFVCSRDLCV